MLYLIKINSAVLLSVFLIFFSFDFKNNNSFKLNFFQKFLKSQS